MSNFISRNFLMCVVPTVIFIFSVYWLRRKKKIKSDTHVPSASDSKAIEECNSDMLHESHNDTNNISIVKNETKFEFSSKSPASLLLHCDESLCEAEIERRNVLRKDETFDQRFNEGLSFLLSNHIENDAIHSSNISINTGIEKETVDSEPVPNHHITHINKSQLESEETRPNPSTNILKSPTVSGNSLFLDSETKSEGSESGIIDMSKLNCISDEMESLGYTEESFNVSDGFISPEDEMQIKKPVAIELESNIARLDCQEISRLSSSNNSPIEQKIVEIIDARKNPDTLEGSDSESSDMLINAFKEIIESEDSFDVQSPDLVQCNFEATNLNSLQSSNVTYEPDAVLNNSEDNFLNTMSISLKENSFNKLTVSDETELNINKELHIEENTAVDSTDGSLPDFNSSETTASLVSEESEKVEILFKEMDLSEHFNMNSDDNINSRSWKASDVQQLAVLSSNKIAESLIDFKTGNLTSEYVYEFDLPQELCGRLIGKQGKTVKGIKERSNANVFIKRHAYDPELKVVVVEGTNFAPLSFKSKLRIVFIDIPITFLLFMKLVSSLCLLFIAYILSKIRSLL